MCSRTAQAFLAIASVSSLFAGSISDQKVISSVQAKVKKLEPRPNERRMDQVGWAGSLTEALQLSKESGRPVFLFTYDGDISTGRC